MTELQNRCSRAYLRLGTLKEIAKWILLLETHATVLEPPELREQILKTAEALVKKYSQAPPQG